MSSANRSRKYDSGSQKRKRKQRIEDLTQSQKGAMDRFIIKESQVVLDNQTIDQGPAPASTVDNDIIVDGHAAETENNIAGQEAPADNTNMQTDNDGDNLNTSPIADDDDSFQPDIFDPRYWDSLDSKQVDILAKEGPKRDPLFQKGPKDRYGRRFSARFYTRILPNREHCDRDWLVYSKKLDRVFCFGCKLFTKGYRKGQLANEGFNDWIHLGIRLKEHETSADHVLNMTNWYELRSRLQKNQTIDKTAQRKLEKEKNHWRKVFLEL